MTALGDEPVAAQETSRSSRPRGSTLGSTLNTAVMTTSTNGTIASAQNRLESVRCAVQAPVRGHGGRQLGYAQTDIATPPPRSRDQTTATHCLSPPPAETGHEIPHDFLKHWY